MTVVAYFAAGLAIGLLYFSSVRWTALSLAGGNRFGMTVAVMAVRFVVLGGVLTAIAWQGAEPLLATAAGLLAGRMVSMRRARR